MTGVTPHSTMPPKMEAIKILETHGANLQAKGHNGLKVVQFAARYGENQEKVWDCIDKIRELEDKKFWKGVSNEGFNLGEENKYGFNILHLAVQNEHWKDEERFKIHHDESKTQEDNCGLSINQDEVKKKSREQ